MELSTIKKRVGARARVGPTTMRRPEKSGTMFSRSPLYTLRHTCLTRCAPHMDRWTLAHLAGHRDMAITKR
jgi:integrase